MLRKFAVELLGTAILVFLAVGVATVMFGFGLTGRSDAAGVVATALAFGLTLLGLVYMIGPISGSHVNPAVTLGAFLTGRIAIVEAIGYWIAQFAGGIIGALVLWGTFSSSPLYSRSVTGLGTDGWGKASMIHIGLGGAFATEVILTAIFVFVVLRVTSATANAATAGHRHRPDAHRGPPGRDPHHRHLGEPGPQPGPSHSRRRHGPEPGVALHRAPLIGGALAAGLHRLLYREEDAGLAAEAQQPGEAENL